MRSIRLIRKVEAKTRWPVTVLCGKVRTGDVLYLLLLMLTTLTLNRLDLITSLSYTSADHLVFTSSTQLCIPPGSLNRVPASARVRGNVTFAGWQVILCDPMWHVSSRSSEATLRTAIYFLLCFLTVLQATEVLFWKEGLKGVKVDWRFYLKDSR